MWERPPRCPRGAVAAAPVVPHAAPPAARPLDPRLEGADLGLRAWLSAQARRGDASGTTEQPPMVRDDPAAMVAGHVLATYLDTAPAGLTARLADWLTQHLAAAVDRGSRARWQWEITMLAWVVEASGLPELFAAFPLTSEGLLAEMGITA